MTWKISVGRSEIAAAGSSALGVPLPRCGSAACPAKRAWLDLLQRAQLRPDGPKAWVDGPRDAAPGPRLQVPTKPRRRHHSVSRPSASHGARTRRRLSLFAKQDWTVWGAGGASRNAAWYHGGHDVSGLPNCRTGASETPRYPPRRVGSPPREAGRAAECAPTNAQLVGDMLSPRYRPTKLACSASGPCGDGTIAARGQENKTPRSHPARVSAAAAELPAGGRSSLRRVARPRLAAARPAVGPGARHGNEARNPGPHLDFLEENESAKYSCSVRGWARRTSHEPP